jgi:hypothetical protein
MLDNYFGLHQLPRSWPSTPKPPISSQNPIVGFGLAFTTAPAVIRKRGGAGYRVFHVNFEAVCMMI